MWTLLALLSSLTAHAQDPYRAVAGAPLLAYVGDQVELSAEWSTGPEPKIYAWEQIEGPPAALDDPAAERPRFLAEHAGTYLFEVTVGDDATRSGPARPPRRRRRVPRRAAAGGPGRAARAGRAATPTVATRTRDGPPAR